MKKKDFILAGSILLLAGIWILIRFFMLDSESGSVLITVDGKEYGRYQLSSEQEIQINETNVLEIRDGEAKMKSADCPDQICVHQRAISKNGESIICLPNTVVVSIEGAEDSQIDVVARLMCELQETADKL